MRSNDDAATGGSRNDFDFTVVHVGLANNLGV